MLPGREVVPHAVLLRTDAHVLEDVHLSVFHQLPLQVHLARCPRDLGRDHVEHRGFSSPVWTQEAPDLLLAHAEGDVLDGLLPVFVGLGEREHFDGVLLLLVGGQLVLVLDALLLVPFGFEVLFGLGGGGQAEEALLQAPDDQRLEEGLRDEGVDVVAGLVEQGGLQLEASVQVNES